MNAPGRSRIGGHSVPPAVTGVAGLAVLAVCVQSTGGLRVELLGADLVLATGGYLTTRSLIEAARSRPDLRVPLAGWYGEQAKKRLPLLLAMLLTTALLGRLLTPGGGTADPGRQLGYSAAAGLTQSGNWYDLLLRDRLLEPGGDWYADRPGEIDPFGALWLLGLLGQFALIWPLLLACVWFLARRLRARRHPAGAATAAAAAVSTAWGTFALVGTLAVAACLVGPVRVRAGAELTELALASHVRAAEWLLGATAAALTAALRARDDLAAASAAVSFVPPDAASAAGPPAGATEPAGSSARGAWVWNTAALIALVGLVASAVVASDQPGDWLRRGGPAVAAGLAALPLAAADRARRPLPPMRLRLPVELGRMAYPLLVLHLPVFAALRHIAPGARPYGVLLVGVAIAWMLALLLQDGLIGRLRPRRWRAGRTAAVLALACAGILAAGPWLPTSVGNASAPGAPGAATVGRGPSVLVLGGTFAGDLAATLRAHAADRYTVSDGSLPGCGLYPVPPPAPPHGRSTRDAQLPAPAPAYSAACADWERRWRAQVARARPEVLVVDLSTDAAARLAGAGVQSPCDPEYRDVYRGRLARAASVWAEIAPGAPVLLADARRETGEADARSSRCYNALIGETIARNPSVLHLDVDGLLCPDGRCRTTAANGPLYTDRVHLTAAGMADIAPWLQREIDRALPTPARPAASAD